MSSADELRYTDVNQAGGRCLRRTLTEGFLSQRWKVQQAERTTLTGAHRESIRLAFCHLHAVLLCN